MARARHEHEHGQAARSRRICRSQMPGLVRRDVIRMGFMKNRAHTNLSPWFLGPRVLQALCVLRILMACTLNRGIRKSRQHERAERGKGRREPQLASTET